MSRRWIRASILASQSTWGAASTGGLADPGNEHGLADANGYRTDVLQALKDLNYPDCRYPGDGLGRKNSVRVGLELAWLTEESNHSGTDEFIQWCRLPWALSPTSVPQHGGALVRSEDALAWLEYCNSSANTHYANMCRKNGHPEPYGVKYWALGNEMTAEDYSKTAYQWAKALRLLDPSIKLISCGETGFADWDRVTLKTLAPVVDFHSIHLYTVSEGNHDVNVMGPAAAEKGIEITKSLIELAKIEGKLTKDITVCFDEWNVWDPVRAPGEKGAEEHYDLSDALGEYKAVASWLNVFVRKADIVKIACIAQSVNVISPIITSPTGLFKQTTYYPLQLFATLMQGTALSARRRRRARGRHLHRPHRPTFRCPSQRAHASAARLTKWIDASAVLSPSKTEIRLAVVNRHQTRAFDVPIAFGPDARVAPRLVVHEVWSPQLGDRNGFEGEKVKTVERKVDAWDGVYQCKEHSFQVLVFTLL
ncbi:Glycoside hydrolase family 51 protein [Mycena sanguinolenta]|uniref:non-reducing end alpha-L-arabinofuranosidase n=1 Tax=Mycena sanguinolenta TaxID=230812 RepID=A0A8H6YZC7_9AGAR|nr:Glycoside hydrolase family 51 protein [Mycena sanguinolenta]